VRKMLVGIALSGAILLVGCTSVQHHRGIVTEKLISPDGKHFRVKLGIDDEFEVSREVFDATPLESRYDR